MQEPVRDVWSRAVARVLGSWQRVLAIHLAFTALGIVLLAPLAGLVGQAALALSGSAAVADQDIARFLLSPVGLLALVLVLALSLLVILLEQAALMALAAAGLRDKHCTARDGLAFAARHAWSVLIFALRLVARILVIVLPFLAVTAGIAWFLLGEHDINFYLSNRPPEFVAAAAIGGALILAAVVLLVRKLLDWAMALPLLVFGRRTPAEAFGESTRLMAGRRLALARVLAKWAAVAIVLSVIVSLVVRLAAAGLLPGAQESIRLFVPVLAALVFLWLLGNLFVVAFNAGTFAQIIVDVYERCGPLPETATPGSAAPSARREFWTTPRLAGVLILAAAAAAATGAWLLQGLELEDQVAIVAHRGAAGAAPENTLAAIERALDDGADWVEIDVQETADGEVVVVHDSDFMKLAGVPLKIWDGTLEQIREIDVGSWYSPVFASERVPTLREVLEVARGRARVVIELKYYGHDVALEQRVVDIVEAADMVDQVAIMSLKYEGIRKIRALRPDWPIGLLSAKALGDLTRLDADFLAVNMGMATSGFLRRARAAGRPVFVWTVNTSVDVSRMASLGVAGIITDEPALARRVLADRENLSVPQRLLIHAAVLLGRRPPDREYRDESP